MNFVRMLLLLSVLFWIKIVHSQENETDCQSIAGGACLDYKYHLISCTSKRECMFIFTCPQELSQNYTECFTISEVCPNIMAYIYTIDYSYGQVAQIASLRNAMDSSEEEDIEEEEEEYEYGEEYNNGNFHRNEMQEQSGNCYYQMVNFFSSGLSLKTFNLKFEKARNQVTLTTLASLQLQYIQCYARDFDTIHQVNISRVRSVRKTRDFLQRYYLNITEEPNIYFCDVSAPMIYVRKRTQEVVGYRNTTSFKYISKISSVPLNLGSFNYFRLELTRECYSRKFNHCKLMRKQNNTIYYFLQDKYFREIAYVEEFMNEVIKNVSGNEEAPTVEYLRNIEYCFKETTQTTNGMVLTWNYTLVGTAATSAELCLDENGMQVTRRCEGDFFNGAYWGEPSADCSTTIYIPDRTYRLHSFIGEKSIVDVFPNITAETDYYSDFTAVDVNLFAEGLNTMSMVRNSRNFKMDFVHGINNIMRVNDSVLRDSQEQLNSTDKILDSMEGFMENIAQEITNFSITIQSNLLTHVSCPFVSNIIGMAIYKRGDSDFTTYDIADILFDQTFDELDLENLELAIYVPTELIYNLTYGLTDEEKASFKIISTVFYNDGLFNEVESANRSAGSRVINVNIPGYSDNFDIPIPLLFRPILNFTDPSCVYWDYGMQKYGEWSTVGGQYLGNFNNQSLIVCTFNHLTHFALLVLSQNIIRVVDDNGVIVVINPLEAHDLALTLITLIGCGLSLLGILGILISAILFKDWYKKRLNSLQLSIIILMEIIILFVADLDVVVEGTACVAIAAILHYIVLAKFTWMLIIARIQYLKFVKIFQNMQVKVHAIIYSLIGWIVPIVPVVLALLIFPENYQAGLLNFCYAEDYALYFFLILPLTIIIFLNIAIFVSILITVGRSKAQDYGVNMQKVQLRLGIMLFFMLGITWIFGIMGELLPWSWFKLTCLYLFCILGSLQGFVLFLFTVLLDKGTMDSWGNLFKITPKSKPYERSTRSEVLYTSDSENVMVNYFGKRD